MCAQRSAVSLKFLKSLKNHLAEFKPKILNSPKRASVAAIFHLEGGIYDETTSISRLTDSVSLKLMFLRRASNSNDRWSGQICFPGGYQKYGETDYETALRESLEETGIDLSQSGNILLGRLNDRNVGRKLVISTFVFLQTSKTNIKSNLQSNEISQVLSLDIYDFINANYPISTLELPIEDFFPSLKKHLYLNDVLSRLQLNRFLFPCINLKLSDREASSSILSTRNNTQEILWGLTFSMTSDLFELANERKLQLKTPFKTSNFILNGLIYAYYKPLESLSFFSGCIILVGAISCPCIHKFI